MTNQVPQKKQMPAFLVLTIICLVAALALAVTNAITKGPIQEHAMKAQREAFGAVMTADEYIEMTIPEGSGISALVEARTDGKTVGYCVAASSGGYAGPVAVTLGVGVDGKVTGAKIGDTSFAETSGFGSRWLAENQTEQFVGIDVKEGGAIEALSGATVTSTAVLNASNTALAAVAEVLNIERTEPVLVFGVAEKKPVEQMTLTGDIHEGSARGFASDVRVQLTMDAAGVITGLAIESSGETPSFGTRCMEEPDFAKQFVGKTAPFAIGGNIDALAGATVTSTAVVNAVNAAVEAPANPDAVPFGSETVEDEPSVEASASLSGDVKTGKAWGFQSDVVVELTVDANGAITELIVKSDKETPGFGTRCGEDEAFLAQFIGKTAPVEADVLSGATLTSEAVIKAVNNALTVLPEGTLTAAAPGFLGEDVGVTVTLNADGTIATIEIDNSKQLPPVCDKVNSEEFLNQFIGKKGPFTADVVAGATFTSQGVIEALNSLFAAGEEERAEDNKLTAAAPGFLGEDVGVTVTLNADGTIATIEIDNSKQLPPVCDKVNDESFLNQFIGKKGPFTADVVAGATFTSQGVIEALNSLFPTQDMSVTGEELPIAETLTAAAPGFLGEDVGVTVTLNADGTIATIEIDNSKQLPPVCDKVNDESFLNQFIGKKGPFTADVVAGATFTSQGVIEALNSLFAAEKEEKADDNKLTAAAPGFLGEDVGVTVTLNADGTIATIEIDNSKQLPPVCDKVNSEEFLNQFIGKKGPFTADVVAGATFTSQGVIDALNSLFAE